MEVKLSSHVGHSVLKSSVVVRSALAVAVQSDPRVTGLIALAAGEDRLGACGADSEV